MRPSVIWPACALSSSPSVLLYNVRVSWRAAMLSVLVRACELVDVFGAPPHGAVLAGAVHPAVRACRTVLRLVLL